MPAVSLMPQRQAAFSGRTSRNHPEPGSSKCIATLENRSMPAIQRSGHQSCNCRAGIHFPDKITLHCQINHSGSSFGKLMSPGHWHGGRFVCHVITENTLWLKSAVIELCSIWRDSATRGLRPPVPCGLIAVVSPVEMYDSVETTGMSLHAGRLF